MDIKKILFKTNEIDVEKALPDAVVFCNKDGKIQWVNDKAAEIFETSKMHLLTSNITVFIENAMSLISGAINCDKALITKFTGKEIYFDMTCKEIEEGYVLAFRDSQSCNDYNNQSVDNEDYKVVNRNKNCFLSKLANDFKSPLQSIVGFSQAMADGLGGNMTEQQDKYIRIIKKNSSDLMYFVEKLLTLSSTEAEIKKPEYKTFDIFNCASSVVKYNEQLYKDKEIKWNILTQEGMKSTVVSDENIIKLILQNVMEVILKSVEMGEVTITLAIPNEEYLQAKNLQGNYFIINISSSALLLSENDLDCLFDPYKIIDTANRKNLLRAIVLACVKNWVQALNGQIWVESQILKNTGFNILIPQHMI
ncbi:MAG: PAS domain-containing sensor histidine kinase [bacterium]|nr:PAS domain-containing sensor histidine kinase [bacterium]